MTGGAGFIGSHMNLVLQDAGHEVTVFDNLSRGFKDAVIGATLVEGDLRSKDDLDQLFKSHAIDLVMHSAALTYVEESVKNPQTYFENNVVGTMNLLSAMENYGVNKFVFSSSCAVYGEPIQVPITEDHPKAPINPYGQNKLAVEEVLIDTAKKSLKSISLRYFNAAGADKNLRAGERHDPETHLIPLVLMEALRLKKGGNPHDTKLKVFGKDFAVTTFLLFFETFLLVTGASRKSESKANDSWLLNFDT